MLTSWNEKLSCILGPKNERYWFAYRITDEHLDINMRFRTTALSGLVLWTGRSDRSADFLAVGIQDGRVEVTYDLGSGETVLRYNTTGLPINDGHWHRMKFTRFVYSLFKSYSKRCPTSRLWSYIVVILHSYFIWKRSTYTI